MVNNDCLVVEPYPSEKWWSQLGWLFHSQYDGKTNPAMFQTTNQTNIYSPLKRNSGTRMARIHQVTRESEGFFGQEITEEFPADIHPI